MSLPTLLDIAKANGSDALVGLLDETASVHPEVIEIPSRTIKGLNYKTLVRTALGRTTGSFRDANDGSDAIKSIYENRQIDTYVMEPRWECDKAVADTYEEGADAYIALEAGGILEGEMQGLAKQFYYGTSNHAKGFPGLLAAYDTTNMCVDAGGTTDDVATSVWLVRLGLRDVTWVWGNNGQMQLSDVRVETITGANSKKLDGYVQTMLARPGLQVLSKQSICRIKKITTDSQKGLTDVLISTALAKFPAGRGPNVAFMTQRSLAQLQASRTATSPTGAPAPFPTSITGIDGQMIPIRVTDAIRNTEKLAL